MEGRYNRGHRANTDKQRVFQNVATALRWPHCPVPGGVQRVNSIAELIFRIERVCSIGESWSGNARKTTWFGAHPQSER